MLAELRRARRAAIKDAVDIMKDTVQFPRGDADCVGGATGGGGEGDG